MADKVYLMKLENIPKFLLNPWFDSDYEYKKFRNIDFAVEVDSFIDFEDPISCATGWYGIRKVNEFDNPNMCILLGYYGGMFSQYLEIDPDEGYDEAVAKLSTAISGYVVEANYNTSILVTVKEECNND